MRNIKMVLAYDGTEYHGWQAQPGQRTVQEVLQSRLQRVLRHPVSLIASGRTDAGVHAAGQVVNFRTTSALTGAQLKHSLGNRLAADLAILRIREVPDGFHATRTALSKLYCYRICTDRNGPVAARTQRYVYHHHRPLDVDAIRCAARHFLGTHDFRAMAALGAPRLSYERTILGCEVVQYGRELHVRIEGTGFLYRQVRNMVGTLLDIGSARRMPDCIPGILESKDRSRAGPTAPAHGLSLEWVRYPPDALIPDAPRCVSAM